jgi:hypothetical protein
VGCIVAVAKNFSGMTNAAPTPIAPAKTVVAAIVTHPSTKKS